MTDFTTSLLEDTFIIPGVGSRSITGLYSAYSEEFPEDLEGSLDEEDFKVFFNSSILDKSL